MIFNNKHILSLLFITGFIFQSFGQTISGGSNQLDFIRESLRINNTTKAQSDADGSPYIFENFVPVKIKGFENQTLSGRFNAYNGQMEIDTGDNVIALNEKKSYEVIFTQKNIVYRSFNYKNRIGDDKSGFLVVIKETEKLTLLKEERIKYYEKIVAQTPYGSDRPARFKRESDRYYFKQGETIKYLSTKKKDLYKLFPNKSKEVKKFLKDNKISLNEEMDLIKLIDFLATL